MSDSIFFTIKLIFWSQKTIDLIKKPLIKFHTLIKVTVGRVVNSIFWSLDISIFRSFVLQSSIFDLSIFSIFTKERTWLNHSRRSFKKIKRDQIDLSITKNYGLNQKTADQIPNPDHSTSWPGCEFDLSIFWSFDLSFNKAKQVLGCDYFRIAKN